MARIRWKLMEKKTAAFYLNNNDLTTLVEHLFHINSNVFNVFELKTIDKLFEFRSILPVNQLLCNRWDEVNFKYPSSNQVHLVIFSKIISDFDFNCYNGFVKSINQWHWIYRMEMMSIYYVNSLLIHIHAKQYNEDKNNSTVERSISRDKITFSRIVNKNP